MEKNSYLTLAERLDYLSTKKFLKLLGWDEFPYYSHRFHGLPKGTVEKKR